MDFRLSDYWVNFNTMPFIFFQKYRYKANLKISLPCFLWKLTFFTQSQCVVQKKKGGRKRNNIPEMFLHYVQWNIQILKGRKIWSESYRKIYLKMSSFLTMSQSVLETKMFSYLIPSHTYMETGATSQNSITAFGLLVKNGLQFWVPSLKQVIHLNIKNHTILIVGWILIWKAGTEKQLWHMGLFPYT